ncbi:MAG: universal stress protein [Microthrixaceae bacterium]
MPLSAGAIIACVDGTEESETVLSEAAAWARALGKSLTILTVIDDTPEPVRPRPGTIHHRTGHDAQEYVDDLVARWAAPSIEVDGLVLRDPIGPAGAVRNYLARRPAALVALVAPDRSGLHRFRRGATAETIVRASSAPCLLIPATANTEGV